MGDTADVGGSTAAGGGEAGAGRPPSPPLSSSEVPVTRAEPASKRTEAPAGSSGVSPAHAPGQTWTEGATAPFTAGVVNIAVIPLRGPIRQEQLDRLAGGLAVLGLITIALGTVAIAAPLLFSLVIEQFLGVLFVLGGVVQVVHGLQLCGVSAPGCSMNLLGGAINLFVGAWLITSPVEGLAGLTILIAAWFFAQGLTKLVLTYQVRHLSTWPSVLVSGVLSLVLSVLILAQWPENAGWVVGVLVGVDFIVTGISLALLGCMAKLGRDMDQAQLGLPTDPLLAERDD